jgi:3-oxoacyl-[acyl-carrier protein] reductase
LGPGRTFVSDPLAQCSRCFAAEDFDTSSLGHYHYALSDQQGSASPTGGPVIYPDLAGKAAVVTGGSRGIGAATAAALASNGVAVGLVGRDTQALASVATSIQDRGGRAVWAAADCTVAAEVDRVVATVADQLGPVDIVAAFAGGNGMSVPTEAETAEHWRAVLDDNLTSSFLTVQAFLPQMVERRRGMIVTMSSAAARHASQSAAAYAAAKAGVIAFTRHLAGEFAGRGIRANCIAPSAIENDRMRARMTDEQREALNHSFPLGRLGQPTDVAAATLFLASDASSWITGATLDIAGGKIML